jgi:hypothetical protein
LRVVYPDDNLIFIWNQRHVTLHPRVALPVNTLTAMPGIVAMS